jgi:hypothetical protein
VLCFIFVNGSKHIRGKDKTIEYLTTWKWLNTLLKSMWHKICTINIDDNMCLKHWNATIYFLWRFVYPINKRCHFASECPLSPRNAFTFVFLFLKIFLVLASFIIFQKKNKHLAIAWYIFFFCCFLAVSTIKEI